MEGIWKITSKVRRTNSGLFLFTPYSTIIYFVIMVFGSLILSQNISVISFIGRIDLSFLSIFYLVVGLVAAFLGVSNSNKDNFLEKDEEKKDGANVIDEDKFRQVLPLARVLAVLALFGYLISFVIQPEFWISKPTNGIKLQTIPGITTLTQIAPLAIALLFIGKKIRVITGAENNLINLLIILATWRAFVNSERLALFEVLIPIAIIHLYFSKNKFWRRYKKLGLPVYLFASFVFFTAQEYYRSWPYYKALFDGNLIEFSFARFISYYASSTRNGIFILSESGASFAYSNLLNFIYNFPILGELFRPNFEQLSWQGYLSSKFGSAEFNTANSFLVLAANASFVGLAIFVFFIFRILRNLFINIANGDLVSLAIYSVLIPGYLELARLNWFTLGRTTPLLVFSFFTFKYYNRRVKTV